MEKLEKAIRPICCGQKMDFEQGFRCPDCGKVYADPYCNRCQMRLTTLDQCGLWFCRFCQSALALGRAIYCPECAVVFQLTEKSFVHRCPKCHVQQLRVNI